MGGTLQSTDFGRDPITAHPRRFASTSPAERESFSQMAFSLNARTGRGRYRPLAEINVTPLVDVMLVLLIIFMVTAPLMTSGVSVDLPKTNAQPLNSDSEPLTVSINAEGDDLPAGPGRSSCPTWSPSCRRSRRTTRSAASSCAATRTWPTAGSCR